MVSQKLVQAMLAKVSTASISNYTEWLNVALNTYVGGGGYTLV
jgi:hypothetical protein